MRAGRRPSAHLGVDRTWIVANAALGHDNRIREEIQKLLGTSTPPIDTYQAERAGHGTRPRPARSAARTVPTRQPTEGDTVRRGRARDEHLAAESEENTHVSPLGPERFGRASADRGRRSFVAGAHLFRRGEHGAPDALLPPGRG